MLYFFNVLFISFSCFSFLCSEDPSCCCEEKDEDGYPRKAHVQLYFSGSYPEENIKDPREDYQWPGINEDSFYDYFTK